MAIQIKDLEQLKVMRRAGLVVAEIHQLIREAIKPGMTTSALDAISAAHIKRSGATPNFLNYHGFPATICVSINDEIVHGIPGPRIINEGDVVSIDCGAIIDGWHGDAAFSIGIGNVDPADQKLMDVCQESMWVGIAAGKNGGKLSDIGYAIEQYVNSQGKYGILQEYGGHGIGTEMHQEPHVLNFGKAGNGPEIIPGMALAIEPMITRGTHKTKVLGDDWTVVSHDKTRGAHFEHTYAICPDGKPFVLTAFDGGKAELARFGVEISSQLS
ncbi:type I methionyl aminopeptidase [Candidatus Planktophila dulcis]|uniref:type I methionyl aminopeptidase n=1 Tax=Candidatus Planktophila dulcis TaxID=1884914 RepID=UPI003CF18640